MGATPRDLADGMEPLRDQADGLEHLAYRLRLATELANEDLAAQISEVMLVAHARFAEAYRSWLVHRPGGPVQRPRVAGIVPAPRRPDAGSEDADRCST